MKHVNFSYVISVTQAMPAKSYAFQVRIVDTVTLNGNFFFTLGASNVSISLPSTESNILKLAVDGSMKNYSRITWNYGSGTLVRPFSLQVRWYIKF